MASSGGAVSVLCRLSRGRRQQIGSRPTRRAALDGAAGTAAAQRSAREVAAGTVEQSRRPALVAVLGAAHGAGFFQPPRVEATFTGPFREAISDLSMSLGGPPGDIYYPEWFLGDWRASSELVKVETPQGDAAAGATAQEARASVGSAGSSSSASYPMRFVSYRGRCIEDRAHDVRRWLEGSGSSAADGPIQDVKWAPSNPNSLSVTATSASGVQVTTDLLVRARAVVVPDGREDLFNTTEKYQQVDYGSGMGGGQPLVSPRRRVCKFKLVQGPKIQLLQRVEVFPLLQTPDVAELISQSALGGGMGEPGVAVAIYRYRVLLEPT